MITKNYKNHLAMMLESFGGGKGMLPVVHYNGVTYYDRPYFNTDTFPSYTYWDCRLNYEPGIWFGSGSTPATENDFTLESKITSGLSFNRSAVIDMDEDGNPFIRHDIMVTNTSLDNITIAELGYFQYVRCASTLNGTDNQRITSLFDRTVLPTPVTIEPNGYAVIRYILKTVISNGE